MQYFTQKQIKFIEDTVAGEGITADILLQNAGAVLAQFITELPLDLSSGIVFLCGNGNNGGDGYVAAKLLAKSGFPVTTVLMCGEPTTAISTVAYCDLSDTDVEVLFLNDNIDKIFGKIAASALVVDAVFGIGFHGEIPPQIKACFSFVKRQDAKKLAVDVPTGANCLNGAVAEGTLRCDYTVTFIGEKLGFLFPPLSDCLGTVITGDIGVPHGVLAMVERPIFAPDNAQLGALLPARLPLSNKGDFGRLVNVAGSRNFPGAAALSTLAALRCGIGLCKLATVADVAANLSSTIFEATFLPLEETDDGGISAKSLPQILDACKTATAVAIGCGIGRSADSIELVEGLLGALTCPIILDADGLNCAATRIDMIKNAKASVTLTPHPAELGRLLSPPISTGEVLGDRFSAALRLSEQLGVTVVAKGYPTIIVGASGCYICHSGNAGLSRGGSGDVLTGMIGALTGQWIPPLDAAMLGVILHGRAADFAAKNLSMQGMLPTDVIDCLPLVFLELNKG